MIMSNQDLFCDGQTIVTATPAASTNVLDLGVNKDIGKGVPIPILIQLIADAVGTTPTLQVDLQVDDNEGFASAKTVQTATISDGVAGDKVPPMFMPEGVDERYARLFFTVTGAGGSYDVTAGLTMGNQTNITG